MDKQKVLNKINSVEAMATATLKECHSLRSMIEGDGSLSPKNQQSKQTARAIQKRHMRLFKKNPTAETAG